MAKGVRRLYAAGAIRPPEKIEGICHTCTRVVQVLKVPRIADVRIKDRAIEIGKRQVEAAMFIGHRDHRTEVSVYSHN